MAKRDMDERFAIQGDPEDALRLMLGANCDRCGHPMADHRLTNAGRMEGVTCQIEGCECHYERRRSR